MNNMEFNKIFAAILVAGIIASLTGFISHKLIHPHELHENAYKIEGVVDDSAAGAAVVARPEPVLAMLAGADLAKGEQSAKICATCHTFNKGGANGIGPNLWNVVNGDKAAKTGFAYSETLAGMEGDWTYASLNKFLWKPKAYVEGTKMNFVGLKKPEDRANVIAWLRSLSDSQPALPGQAEIDAENAELAPPPAESEETAPDQAVDNPASEAAEEKTDEKGAH